MHKPASGDLSVATLFLERRAPMATAATCAQKNPRKEWVPGGQRTPLFSGSDWTICTTGKPPSLVCLERRALRPRAFRINFLVALRRPFTQFRFSRPHSSQSKRSDRRRPCQRNSLRRFAENFRSPDANLSTWFLFRSRSEAVLCCGPPALLLVRVSCSASFASTRALMRREE